jgi:hypothetical protein
VVAHHGSGARKPARRSSSMRAAAPLDAGSTGPRREALDEAVQPIRLLVDHLQQIAAALGVKPLRSSKVIDADQRGDATP